MPFYTLRFRDPVAQRIEMKRPRTTHFARPVWHFDERPRSLAIDRRDRRF